jgi:hypothetical protein
MHAWCSAAFHRLHAQTHHTTSIADGTTGVESAGGTEKAIAARPKALETWAYGKVGMTPNENVWTICVPSARGSGLKCVWPRLANFDQWSQHENMGPLGGMKVQRQCVVDC